MSYVGCKMFVIPTGLAGIVLQTEGELAGCVWDFFVSPRSTARSAYDMMMLAIGEGCTRVVTYNHLLLTNFFERFGFEVVARSSPPDLLHMILRTDVFNARQPHLQGANAKISARANSALGQPTCAFCDLAPAEPPLRTETFGGYICNRCRFLHVCGTLTPPPPEPPLGPVRLASNK